jgi:hypothetical protein
LTLREFVQTLQILKLFLGCPQFLVLNAKLFRELLLEVGTDKVFLVTTPSIQTLELVELRDGHSFHETLTKGEVVLLFT